MEVRLYNMRAMLRRLRSMSVIAALCTALVATMATPAHALNLWFFGDNFENNPGATWWFEHEGTGTGIFTQNDGFANSGLYYADLGQFSGGWSSVNHSFTLPGTFLRQCTASAWFMPLPSVALARIEVLNAATRASIASGLWIVQPPFPSFEQRALTWSGGPSNVIIRFVLVGDLGTGVKLKVDDVGVRCTW
jgi:hypothetical protein